MCTYSRRKAAGLCALCGKSSPRKGLISCSACAALKRRKQRRKRKKLMEDGKCYHCGRLVSSGNRLCNRCLQVARQQTKDHRMRGECTHCSRKAVAGAYCLKCWFGNLAYVHLGSRSYGPALEEKWAQQGGRCAYTGESLVPGTNASLDHISPIGWGSWRSRRGTTKKGKVTPSMVQWVTKRVNSAKSDMTHREFLRLCKLVARRHT